MKFRDEAERQAWSRFAAAAISRMSMTDALDCADCLIARLRERMNRDPAPDVEPRTEAEPPPSFVFESAGEPLPDRMWSSPGEIHPAVKPAPSSTRLARVALERVRDAAHREHWTAMIDDGSEAVVSLSVLDEVLDLEDAALSPDDTTEVEAVIEAARACGEPITFGRAADLREAVRVLDAKRGK